jgi:RNase adaptor protein for sRNA GlmZ degradation
MLNINIFSFSYKISGIPEDMTPNGGGFVFDCRFIYNPGREPAFQDMTGKHKPVKDFLDNDSVMNDFMKNAVQILESAVDNYLERNFTDLMISFGCTGGQHRSVYAAEK